MSKKTLKNKNGNMSLIEFVKLIHHEGEMEQFLRGFSTLRNPCPPYELIELDPHCFKCMDCIRNCMGKIKQYKNHYLVGKKKITFEELDNTKEE